MLNLITLSPFPSCFANVPQVGSQESQMVWKRMFQEKDFLGTESGNTVLMTHTGKLLASISIKCSFSKC